MEGEHSFPDPEIPINEPLLRWEDLDTNSSMWEYMQAAPDDETIIQMWLGLGSTSLVVTVVVLVVASSLLISQRTRTSPFNMYLFYLMMPDLLFSGSCAVFCLVSAAHGSIPSPAFCKWQGWFLATGVAGNAWMNFAITRQIHMLVRGGYSFVRYKPPTQQRVAMEAAYVYLFASALGVLAILPQTKFPVRTYAQTGFVCNPAAQYDAASTAFWYLVWGPALFMIPLIYVSYVGFDIYSNNLLPENRSTRMFTFFFLRIILVFFLWWMPGLLLVNMIPKTSYWVKFAGTLWCHLQGMVSALLCLAKPDIRLAVAQFISCKCAASFRGENVRSSLAGGSSGGAFFSRPFSKRRSDENHQTAQQMENEGVAAVCIGAGEPDCEKMRQCATHADATHADGHSHAGNQGVQSGVRSMEDEVGVFDIQSLAVSQVTEPSNFESRPFQNDEEQCNHNEDDSKPR